MDILSADSKDIDHATQGVPSTRVQSRLESAGILLSRYGLVLVLLLIGVLKFTPGEAAAIQPLVAHSPLMSWMYSLLGVQGVSNIIGVIEIATAALMALRPLSPKASFVGSLAAVVTFLLTVSFLFSTPGAVQLKYGFPVLGDAGQFLIKDLVLLGASFWTAAEAHRAAQRSGPWLVLFATTPIRLTYR
jgi:reactive chlorine resistance protein C